MKIPALINWLMKQDQRLEVTVIEKYTEYKDYSGKEETNINSVCFHDPNKQSSIEHGVLILGSLK